MGLPRDCPGIAIVQHMPEKFTAQYAQRLDKTCPMGVREARDGDRLERGTVLIAPGARHMQLRCTKRSAGQDEVFERANHRLHLIDQPFQFFHMALLHLRQWPLLLVFLHKAQVGAEVEKLVLNAVQDDDHLRGRFSQGECDTDGTVRLIHIGIGREAHVGLHGAGEVTQ